MRRASTDGATKMIDVDFYGEDVRDYLARCRRERRARFNRVLLRLALLGSVVVVLVWWIGRWT